MKKTIRMEYKALRVAGRSARYNALAYKQDWSGANRRRAKILGVNRRLANDESSMPQKKQIRTNFFRYVLVRKTKHGTAQHRMTL